jgi:hypothetical protein
MMFSCLLLLLLLLLLLSIDCPVAVAAEKAMYEPLTPWCMFSPRLAKVG